MAAWKGVVGFGLAMVVLGVVAYFATGRTSYTALIPSAVGVLVLGLGLLAMKVGRGAVIGAGLLGVLAATGPIMRVVPPALNGELVFNAAVFVQVSFLVIAFALIGFVGWAVVKKK